MRAVYSALILALAACGDSPSNPSPDGGVPDGPPIAPAATNVVHDAAGQPASTLTFADSDDATLRIVNQGTAASDPVAVEITGAGAADVTVDPASSCLGQVLAPAAECNVTLHYAPATDEVRQSLLYVSQTSDQYVVIQPVARPALRVTFAGGGAGEVQVSDADTGATLATCTATCRARATAGQHLRVTAATPALFGGIAGACISSEGSCAVTFANGAQVTATFVPLAGEAWTRLLPGARITSAAYDAAGNLVVANGKLTKLSPTGATLWSQALAFCTVATGPGDTIYGQTATTLYKLRPDGTTLWSKPLDARAIGCGNSDSFDGFLHNLAVGADGAVAVRGTTGVARWTTDGALGWSAPITSATRFAVAIDPAGNVTVAIPSINGETTDLARFAANGTALADQEGIAVQYHGMHVIDATGRLLASSSGHSHVDALGHSVDLGDPDFVPNGICAAGTGAAWLYELSDSSSFGRPWVLNRYAAGGAQTSTLTVTPPRNPQGDLLGGSPHDLAGASDGHVAVAGGFVGAAGTESAWVTAFRP